MTRATKMSPMNLSYELQLFGNPFHRDTPGRFAGNRIHPRLHMFLLYVITNLSYVFVFRISPLHFLFEEGVPGGTTVVTGPQSRLEDFDPATGEGHPGMKVRRNRGNSTELTRNPTTGGKQRDFYL